MRQVVLWLLCAVGCWGSAFVYGAVEGVYGQPANLNNGLLMIVLLMGIVAPVVLPIALWFGVRATKARKREALLEKLKLDYRFDLEGRDDWGSEYWVDTSSRTAVLLSENAEPEVIRAADVLGVSATISTSGYKTAGTCLQFKFCDPTRAPEKLHFQGTSGKAELVHAKLAAAGFNKQGHTTESLIVRRLRVKSAPTGCPACIWRRDECNLAM